MNGYFIFSYYVFFYRCCAVYFSSLFLLLFSFIFFFCFQEMNIFSSTFQFRSVWMWWPEIVAAINGTNIFQLHLYIVCMTRTLYVVRVSVCILTEWQDDFYRSVVVILFHFEFNYSKIQARNNHKTLAWFFFPSQFFSHLWSNAIVNHAFYLRKKNTQDFCHANENDCIRFGNKRTEHNIWPMVAWESSKWKLEIFEICWKKMESKIYYGFDSHFR